MRKSLPLLSSSLCLLAALLLPAGGAQADIYKDIAALKKQTKRQRGDIKLLKLRLDRLEQLLSNLTATKQKTAASATRRSGEITYP